MLTLSPLLLLILPHFTSPQGVLSEVYTPTGTYDASASSITIVYNRGISSFTSSRCEHLQLRFDC